MSDSKKWTAMMSRKPELDLGGQARKIENQRLQIKRLTEKNLGLRSALDDSKTRIAELEAEVARLQDHLRAVTYIAKLHTGPDDVIAAPIIAEAEAATQSLP